MQPGGTIQPNQTDVQNDQSFDGAQYTEAAATPEPMVVQWTASEYVAHHKSAQWYMTFAIIALATVVLVYLMTRGDIVGTAVIVIVAILFAVAAGRPPRVRGYQVLDQGIMIDNKPYPFGAFKSFSVIEEGAINSISLWPLRRFTPPLSLYYPPEQEDQILGALSQHLPFEQRSADVVDRLMRKLHF